MNWDRGIDNLEICPNLSFQDFVSPQGAEQANYSIPLFPPF